MLVLDEPTNGLDPQGIVDMRTLIQELRATHGKTILLSSHLLSEVEKIATHFGILNAGKLLFQGTKEELVRQRLQSDIIRVETIHAEKTLTVLQDQFDAIVVDDTTVHVRHITKERVPELVRYLAASGVDIYSIGLVYENLEETFFQLIS